MMICRADFEELFPHLFQPEHVPDVQQIAKPPSAACIARWEDDGGRHAAPARHRRTAPVPNSAIAYVMGGAAKAGVIVATAPAIATYAAISAMLSACHQMSTHRHVMSCVPPRHPC